MSIIKLVTLFLATLFIYFAVGTQFSFKPKWGLDYFNPMAKALLQLKLDIPNPASTYDLAEYKGKWYGTWGILPALLLIPVQLVMGRYIPIFYLNIFLASINVVILYLLLQRIKKEFLPHMSSLNIAVFFILFAFGTTHFYIGTLPGVWHVSQMMSFSLSMLALFIVFKKKRTLKDYFISTILLCLTFFGRPTLVFFISLPLALYICEFFSEKRKIKRGEALKNGIIVFGIPMVFFTILFLFYNFIRFENPFEYGYKYIHETSYVRQIREANDVSSIKNIPQNLWYLLFEIPSLSFDSKVNLGFNLKGNSIFFLTPPFLAILLASPFKRKKQKLSLDPYLTILWVSLFITILPTLMHFGSGWMQFGYRYSLDVTGILLLLTVFGMKGRINLLFVFGVFVSIYFYLLGINALM